MTMARALLASDPDNVATQLMHAYLVERTGRPVQAWELYSSLAEGNYGKTTSLSCDKVLVYGGAVSDVARFRSIWLAQSLKAQGVELTPPIPPMTSPATPEPPRQAQMVILPPPFSEFASNDMPDAAPAVPVREVPTMASPSNAGVFVHLASYKGPKALERGWTEISSRHKAVLSGQQKATRSFVQKDNKGTILRLGVQIADRAAAQSLCKALKAERQYCMVLK
ncbi:MAG: SPOR domain-containing protein [Rhodospirillales bacterium]|nr:SPOR domain-containing protein [Rhodospirillales bacterium]